MPSHINPSTLIFLGRRIERLLYVGIFLLILCFVELYLVSASVYYASEDAASVGALLTRIETDKERLSSLFQSQQFPQERKLLAKREQRVAETRRKLGLPPMLVPDSTTGKETYGHALSTTVTNVARDIGTDPEVLGKSLDVSKSPDELIKNLRELQKSLEKKPVIVWGVETPLLFSIQYGGSDYRIPARFLATSLMIALIPLLIGWFGSLYLTRQRELLAISELQDYKLAFPHILNLMPIVFTKFEKRYGANYPKGKRFERATHRIVLSTFRSILILAFAVPMVFIVAYSMFQLLTQFDNLVILYMGLASILITLLFMQSLFLVLQEWLLLHKKEFYE